MRLVSFEHFGAVRVGVVIGDRIRDVSSVAPTMAALVEGGSPMLERVACAAAEASDDLDLQSVRLLAPFPDAPRNILCVGLNYLDHAAEGARAGRRGGALPERPVWFSKAVASICGPFDDIPVDLSVSAMYDWEAELALVIGREGRRISRERAFEYIHSYTVFNDFTARDIQHAYGEQWFKGKSIDRSSPLGPWLVTPEELESPPRLRVTCSVNGQVRQDSNTGLLIFDIPTLIADISETITLAPGDIISTGTPSGTGSSSVPREFLKPGDVLETRVEGIGVLRNRIVQA